MPVVLMPDTNGRGRRGGGRSVGHQQQGRDSVVRFGQERNRLDSITIPYDRFARHRLQRGRLGPRPAQPAAEPRLKALVGNCCLPTYRGIEREGLLHCFPNFIPGIYPEYDTPDVAALIAPRPLHLNFGELDRGSPIDEARRAAEVIARAYQQHSAAENFSCYVEPGAGHVLSNRMWERVQAFFARHLG
ncbi:unnamed protein product [marine sediment metagenome]|uniref:Peptidase S9 prolyl oligopeptidase catalytic domain-containing protein n=1 Tax=marine sediment metagenome TaxID=412755 RepID=X1CZM7_9ZZZZ